MYDDYDSIRRQAEERVRKRKEATDNMIGFFLIDGLLWVAWIGARLTGFGGDVITPGFWGLLIMSVIWGFIAIGTWYEEVYAAEERDEKFRQEVEKEIERELERRALTEKRKRLGLSDDGELVEILDDDYAPANDEDER